MKLQEKIYYCRKKAGLSQEALAEKLGVSRQAVSKWETGDAVPELGKLPLLAKAFGVSADWLLSEDAPEEPAAEKPSASKKQDVLNRLPGFLRQLFRRYGWLGGVYLAAIGAMFTVIGALMRHVFWYGFSGNFDLHYLVDDGYVSPITIFYTFVIVLGIVMLLAGIILAIVLKRWGKK